ncbi:DUF4291 domain-containing protein [Cronobacter muytjensii]|uniref:DUF4291 domain-containing protein n=1 Tax=Cronobacter muytjensii TaxID=413501 RepID=A0A2T7AIM9_9ENTR|nr:DUF4291 domain-containing protein [Cronobacter muytjensii]KAB0878129.1 DUF4291 domain-containing protein [Cronobacter muytjensii]MBF4812123.1 DUF4291 domain-containing protein [Cronobacter muytjensii]PUX07781.1 DUF4291 domain-containing protein [Cronobacter muytjensii]
MDKIANSLTPTNEIRAYYTDDFIRVYQAFSDEIAESALENKTFVSPPFSMSRMTWIKPSFLWMMYRSGWAKKDSRQKRILAIDISHAGFREIINSGVLSSHGESLHNSLDSWRTDIKKSDIIIQWDPERDIYLNKLNYRTIQIGLRNQAVENYCKKWIVDIQDVTPLAHTIHELVLTNDINSARKLLPVEKTYAP